MTDMLVKLYDLPLDFSFVAQQASQGVAIRKPIGAEKGLILDWAGEHWQDAWRSEVDVAMSNVPISCFIAVQDNELIGISCYDATALGFFSTMGVLEPYQGQGTGKALLLACMQDMKLKGYGYAIIGSAGPVDFYRKAVGAVPIPDSVPGMWRGWLYR